MQRSKHLVHPRQSANGVVHRVTPKSAGWTYVGFEARDLKAGKRVSIDSGATETCVVVLSGKARVRSKGFDSGTIGARAHVFEAPPWSVYLPAGSAYSIKAVTDCEVAICTAPGKPGRAARVIAPDEVETLTRGKGSNTRYIRNVLPESAPADSLLVVEAITPGGHWSSYPPHKHDRDAIPEESYLEETYYHRISPPQGFALQRRLHGGPLPRRDAGGRRPRRGAGAARLPPGRRAARLRPLLSQRDGRPEAHLALLQRPRPRVDSRQGVSGNN